MLMRVDRRLLNWGLFFILLGAIPLAVRQGYLSAESVGRWWTLWPLLLVAAGVGLLLSRTSLHFLGGLITAGTLGLMAGGLLSGSFTGIPFGNCSDEQGARAFPSQSGQFGAGATVRLELNCGVITVGTAAGAEWRVEGADEEGRGPLIDAASDSLRVRSDDTRNLDFFGRRDRWTVTLPQGPALDIDLTLNAGRGTIDLAGAAIQGLQVTTNAAETRIDLTNSASLSRFAVEANAGSIKLDLPNRSVNGRLTVNAGSIDFCVPDGAGVRVRTNDNIAAGNNFGDRGLSKSGNTWETPGYGSASVQIELEADANAAGLNLNPTGGCHA